MSDLESLETNLVRPQRRLFEDVQTPNILEPWIHNDSEALRRLR